MKYTKLFNNHDEYVAYTASTSFIRPNVSWCILEEEPHCTPALEPCEEQHIYALVGSPSYPSTVPASATSFNLSFTYSDTYTARTCEEGVTEYSETTSIEIEENFSTSARTISGSYVFHGISIPYSLTQEGIVITVTDPVISCNGTEITITCATARADIYYQLDHSGSYTQYTTPITMTADTFVECYAELSGVTSNVVTATCEYNPTHDYSQDYLTFRVTNGGTIRWNAYGSGYNKVIQYSINDGEWTSITAGSSSYINVATNDAVRFKGVNASYAKDKSNYAGFDSGGNAVFDIEGNIMSLIYGDNFVGQTAMTGSFNFCSIFKSSKVVSAENLILPSTTLTQYCYRAMFSLCPNLVTPPALPATTLAQGCYWYMFEKCPMTTAPELLATTLVNECYGYMFNGCNNLNYIKCLATSGLTATSALTGWVTSVASSGTFVKDSSTTTGSTAASTVWTRGNNGIPTNWLVQDETTVKSPTISFDGFNVITLSCETEGADIFYKLNNTGNYSAYTTAIVINEDTFIETYAELNSESSVTTSQTCVYVSDIPIEYSNRDLKKWQYNGNEIATPYSVNAIDSHSSSYAKGTFNFETSFVLREAEPTYLWFQHADQSAEIFVDGVSVEKHWGGYAAFTTDISNYVHSGVNNIKVALKNNEGNNLAPADADFNFNATLGNVKLMTSQCVPAMNYGYDGFHITSTVSDAEATMYIKTNVPTGATLVCKIDDGNTNIYSATSASTGEEMTFTKVISNPHLWDGTLDPHMYTVTLEIYKGEDLYHRFVRPYGLRYYEYVIGDTEKVGTVSEPYTGFLLNGHKYLLRGCCMHDDIAGKANALNETDYDNTFATIQELGLNFLRLAHYPHPKEVYDRCDALGIIVQTEAPCVNKLQSTMPSAYYEHLIGQYTDMVNQHYNHPCIIFWGLSNETQTDNTSFGKQKVEQYTTLIKSLDTERLVGYVLAQGQNANPSAYYGDPQGVDWFGCNMYVGWYNNPERNNPSNELQTRLNNTVARIGKPIAYSEYGCGGTQDCYTDNISTTNKGSGGARHDIENMMWLHEGHIAAIKNFPQLISTSQWQLFDVAVSKRNEGYTVCLDGDNTSIDNNLRYLNDKGLVERDHVTKKDTFYLYKAWWNTTDKFVHICQKSFTRRIGRTIKCYSNDGDTFKLYVNGTLVETVTANDNIVLFTPRTFNNGDIIKVSGSTSSDEFTMPTSPSYNIVLTTKYNVTDTVNPTIIGGSGYVLSFEEIEIDGVKQQDVTSAYTFSTPGEHTVKYKLDNNSIDAYAFNGCSNLVSVDMPNDVTILRDGCFKECTSLTSITMSSGITLIENSAFKGCSSLLNITLPDNLTSIKEGVFSGCTSLEAINIPSGITNFSTNNLYGCYSLSSITVDSNNTTYDSRDNCNAIIITKNNSLIYGCKNTVIPNTVTKINESAFNGCSSLTNITIPDSVTSIGTNAFNGCSSLANCTIGSGVTSIGASAFHSCSSLTNITIPDSVTSIGTNAFHSCSSLTSCTIGNGVTSIGQSAFHSCSSLTSCTIGNGVTSIGQSAFRECSSLANCTIGSGVTSIGSNAFIYCSGLTSVTIPNSVTSINNATFYGCSSLASINIPDSVTSIGQNAFYGCSSLTSCTIGNGVISIREYAFQNCTGLTSIDIPNNVTSIEKEAFKGCSSLSSATIGSSVTSIKENVFVNCTSLISIVSNATTAPSIYGGTFYGVHTDGVLTVPAGSSGYDVWMGTGNYYLGKYNWTKVEEGSLTCKFNVTSTSEPTAIIGSEEFYNNISAIEIDGVELPSVVSAYTFSTTGRHTVKYTLTDPTTIGSQAFNGCNSLTSVAIPNSVTSIGNYAFYGCSSLTSIDIPNSVTSIGISAFYGCSSLTNINIPSGVTTIWYSAFNGCSSLTSINIPSGVTSIDYGTFYDCTGLTSINIPSGVTSIGMDAFYNCKGVTDVYCYPNPANLTWNESEKDDFKSDGSTICHVYSQYLDAYETKFGDEVNVTFVGDLHDYVEIAGTKWATMNIGANTPTDYGLYFQWGDTSGYTIDQIGSGQGKKYFGGSDYKYSNGGMKETNMVKYNTSDNLTTLEDSDDGAKAYWGDNWRIPTKDEYDALLNATTTAWTNNYQGSGVSGYVLTDKTDSTKKLFFPAAGEVNQGVNNVIGSFGEYWSKARYTQCNLAWILEISYSPTFGRYIRVDSGIRVYGMSIRPVKDA